MGWESFGVIIFYLGLLQGQTRIAKLKSAYNSLIIGPRQTKTKYTCYCNTSYNHMEIVFHLCFRNVSQLTFISLTSVFSLEPVSFD